MRLKDGRSATVYLDPVTRHHVEGQATLVSQLDSINADGLEYWKVEFPDGDRVPRLVHTEDIVRPARTLRQYAEAIETTKCRLCGRSLLRRPVDHYDHPEGWPVHGFNKLQWLSIKCPKCDYDWSLWKLGLPRYEGR